MSVRESSKIIHKDSDIYAHLVILPVSELKTQNAALYVDGDILEVLRMTPYAFKDVLEDISGILVPIKNNEGGQQVARSQVALYRTSLG